MAKRSHDETTLSGYLSNVSPVKCSATGTTKYFTAQMQTSKDEIRRLVSFAPEKHAEFMQSSQKNTPIKLTDATVKCGRDGAIEIMTNRRTRIEIAGPLAFKKKILQLSADEEAPNTSKLNELTTENMVVSDFTFCY